MKKMNLLVMSLVSAAALYFTSCSKMCIRDRPYYALCHPDGKIDFCSTGNSGMAIFSHNQFSIFWYFSVNNKEWGL